MLTLYRLLKERDELLAALNDKGDEVTVLSSETSKLRGQLAEARLTIAGLEGELDGMRDVVIGLRKRVVELEGDITVEYADLEYDSEQQLAEAQERIAELEAEREAMQEIAKPADELRRWKKMLKAELDQLADQIEENIHELRVWVEEDLTGRKSIRK